MDPPPDTDRTVETAFTGEVELLNAKWDLDSGRTVEFRITGEFSSMRHPFKDFTRKRNGRVGTRFKSVCARSAVGEIQYDGEMMLADWQEKPGTGMTVRFWLDDEATAHPFAGCTKRGRSAPGEMFALALVELNEMNERVQPDQEDLQHGRKKRTLSQDAHLMVTSEMFVQYLREMSPRKDGWSPQSAKDYVKAKLGIESLSVLDHDPAKRADFHEKIRRPYADWNGAH